MTKIPSPPPQAVTPSPIVTGPTVTSHTAAQTTLFSPPIQLLSALWNLWQSLVANGAARLREGCGLNLKEFITLGYLQARAYTPAELAQAVQMPRYEVSRLLSDLEAAGFVGRSRHQSDGRQVSVTITGSGRAAWELGLNIAQDVTEPYLSGLSEPQRTELIRTLTSLNAAQIRTDQLARPDQSAKTEQPEGES